MTASLLVGPLLRHAGETDATVWVETDAPCTVEVLGHRAATFTVAGHHYALVHVEGLTRGSATPYEVLLDGERAWPAPGARFPPSVIRTPSPGDPVVIAFGSCRVSVPNEPPYTLRKDEDARGREVDALRALAMRLASDAGERWPHLLLLLGDQVYADEVSPETRRFIAARRDASVPPGETVADFEEYTRLYREAWCEPHIRWLLSTVPSAMIFDDHDIVDDWNTSATWVRRMRATGWWDRRIVGGLMSYWVYQHIGNLAPPRLAEWELWRRVRDSDDATRMLREFAFEADRDVEGKRWSYSRDLPGARLVVVDSRAGRVLDPGRRSMLDEGEWSWLHERVAGAGADHLLIASSLPVLLAPALHYLEAWSERICDGAWGRHAARLGERMREGLDLEHWAAFGASLERLMGIVEEAASAEAAAPASITLLSGDVHHAYLAEARFPDDVRSNVWQAVCSPFRNPLDAREQRAIRIALSRPGHALGRALALTAGVRRPRVQWRVDGRGPWFDNQVATLTLEGRHARLVLEKTVPDGDALKLERVFEHPLA